MESDFYDILIKYADNIVESVNKQGCVIGGVNGPYKDIETPYRVCSHWIFIFDYLYKKTNKKEYINTIKKIGNYLYEQYLNNDNKVFKCREKTGKDTINGTIGNAWIIEGLVRLASILNDKNYYDAAKSIFYSFPFDEKKGIWKRMEIDGKELGFDITFNHQLWFAAAGCQIVSFKKDKQIERQINIFIEKCQSRLLANTYKDGLIKHFLCTRESIIDIIKYQYRNVKNDFRYYFGMPSMRYKEEGYHFFAMYGWAILYEKFSNKKFFRTRKFKKCINYTFNENNYLKLINEDPEKDITRLARDYSIESNIYSYYYNSPFYEIPFIYLVFKKEKMSDNSIQKLWEIQKKITVDNNSFSKSVFDENTLSARLYELTRYLERIEKF